MSSIKKFMKEYVDGLCEGVGLVVGLAAGTAIGAVDYGLNRLTGTTPEEASKGFDSVMNKSLDVCVGVCETVGPPIIKSAASFIGGVLLKDIISIPPSDKS